tara:strand:- start:15294 stop:15848 length:555 start_codon:yes stop_codon:yes gene_type:complete
MNKFFLISFLLCFIACDTNDQKLNQELNIEEQFKNLSLLNDSLKNTKFESLNNKILLGREIKTNALKLYNNHQLDYNKVELEFLMQCAANGSEAAQQFNDAANYFSQAQKRFPNSKNAPAYLHNKARILDDILNDKNNARIAYEDLIDFYPEHPLSKNAAIYLENAFGKSEEELLDLINNSSSK